MIRVALLDGYVNLEFLFVRRGLLPGPDVVQQQNPFTAMPGLKLEDLHDGPAHAWLRRTGIGLAGQLQ